MYVESDFERPAKEQDHQGPEWRNPVSRDYGRIVHSASFRRQQGKTQVFPGHESDFFRNRLTHSLEVAQIAEGIADRLNTVYKEQVGDRQINGRLCAAAGLVHDIGHPPFGHNGERALDDQMKQYGGFEGNAQTLRILSRLEKKFKYDDPVGNDERAGLNLCFRTLAAVLKYDEVILEKRDAKSDLAKGYYESEAPIVARIKEKVLRGKALPAGVKFKTTECAIMDIADDIAYSVYDLEDSLKAGFLTPASILSSDDKLLKAVAEKVVEQLGIPVTEADVLSTFVDVFKDLIPDVEKGDELVSFIEATRTSNEICSNGYVRTALSSLLVHEFINGVEFVFDDEYPALSKVSLGAETRKKVEVLKQYTFTAIIYSSRVKLGEYRGTELVKDIFEALKAKKGHLLMPDDVRERYLNAQDDATKARTICDFVAGMTDRYAVEFWARLRSDAAESMFKSI
ncbi:dNTP triphosphohydrolase (plasmid) [Rhizobium sp. CB3060]|uniref:dGTP triphosphohydrolase n=1 Tax=Rhizobium sp. CB3060 TaxID=3138255 RepID=UPI0021A6548E|nr:dNTP triphosphohydrolase [Rhizobium tropici]UWU25445.1 dNTP triphosphohydrolase [Rhizobium tropici]